MAGKSKNKGAKHVTSKVWQNYEAKGEELVRKNPSCPKCGSAVIMAKHKDRASCGKCGYTEFNKK